MALLLRHRGAFFLGVVCVCLWGLIDASSRRLASALVAWSMLSFLWLYVGAGRPEGALEKIARLDLLGLIPLGVVLPLCVVGPSERMNAPRISIAASRAAYVGPGLELAPHRNAAATVAIALEAPFSLSLSKAAHRRRSIALIPPNTLHHLQAKGPMAFVYLDALS